VLQALFGAEVQTAALSLALVCVQLDGVHVQK
jgi:hypothetical protein